MNKSNLPPARPVALWLVLLAALVSAFNALFRYSIGAIIYLDTQLRVFG